ncbi:hypothetical protein D8770_25180 [Methylobacterium sp. DB1607]|nr:hypothetical protein [Methylobacterium sp. DB1607]
MFAELNTFVAYLSPMDWLAVTALSAAMTTADLFATATSAVMDRALECMRMAQIFGLPPEFYGSGGPVSADEKRMVLAWRRNTRLYCFQRRTPPRK